MIGPMMGHPEGNLSQGFGSGSGFQISLDPDPVSAQVLEQKKLQ